MTSYQTLLLAKKNPERYTFTWITLAPYSPTDASSLLEGSKTTSSREELYWHAKHIAAAAATTTSVSLESGPTTIHGLAVETASGGKGKVGECVCVRVFACACVCASVTVTTANRLKSKWVWQTFDELCEYNCPGYREVKWRYFSFA